MIGKVIVFGISVILLTCCVGAAAQAPLRIHKSEFSRTAIVAGDLKLTITDISIGASPFGMPKMEIEIENIAATAAPFDPQQLSFVRADGHQVEALAIRVFPDILVTPRVFLIISGARLQQSYYMNEKLQLPARMYYQGKLIAEITE